MCVRYTQRRGFLELRKRLGPHVPSILPLWNQSPGKAVMTLRKDVPPMRDSTPLPGLRITMLDWGYRETWMTQPGAPITGPLPYARAEKAVLPHSLSSTALRERRCIVLADGWYEWPRVNRKRDENNPHYFRFRDDRLFGFAGIWARCDPEPGIQRATDTVALLTTSANELVARVHDRMPVILMQQDWDRWLSIDTPGSAIIRMMQPFPAGELEAWRVGDWVNDRRCNEATCIAPMGPVIRV